SYAVVSYQTAWLKCHYPREYMAALLSSVLDNTNKLSAYIAECLRLGIHVLPPQVNESGSGFTVSGKDIRFGLLAVRNLGRGFIDSLVAEREKGGRFTGFFDFCRRMYGGLNRRALESLVKSGALDGLGLNRRRMLSGGDSVLDYLDEDGKQNV
ncbi:MAG TPA: DNA polymerase III subunit alpha, partial [Ruminococcaceae bacterium]|nr:DNA polymerase III subunit alpha [Oscillospiraceae bacterium]